MNSGINCVVDTPILQELYNKVKNKVESYEEFKTLVSLWWRREKQKNPQFDYEVYPSPEEIDSLLSERTNKKEEGMDSTISYTPKGKRTQVYTIKGSHIYNRDGKEVFAKDSIDRNKIFANFAVKSGRAVVVEHNNSRYVVNDRNQIISVTTGKMMQWDEKNGDRNAIIKAAQEKFNGRKSVEIEEAPIFEDNETSSEERGTAINNFIPFSEEIEELSLEERGLTPAINPNDLEAKADVAFGTPQRRRDRVNLIANAIRQNFSIEFERQKRALQERISSETDADKIVELQEQLDTLDEKRAVELGLNNILVRIKKMFQPKDSLPAYYNSEFVKLQNNWDIVVTEALELLKETDGLAVDFIETNFDEGTQIDEESGDYFDDDSQKEYGYKDGWMTKARFVDQRDSLSKKVRKIIWTTDKISFDGKPEIDDLGFKRYLQPDMVQATLLQAFGQSRNSEHFWKILNGLAKRKKWVQPLIDRLNKEEDTKSQFYQNFRKEFMPYWVQLQKEVKNTDGEVISVVTQTKG